MSPQSPPEAGPDADDDRPYWLAFSLVPGLGPVGFAVLLRRFGSAAAAWREGAPALSGLPRLAPDAIVAFDRLRHAGVATVAGSLEASTRAAGGRIVTPLDPGYPAALRELEPRPPILHIAGSAAALQRRAVAVVGTRRPSGYGLSTALDVADELARAGLTVVSGLAIGIDAAAHRAALAAGGTTVAVLPSPLRPIYPPRNRGLAAEIVQRGGALVTELAIGHVTGRPDFARRNRIIAGLAEATVVVEAPDRSGAMLTSTAATAIGREVYAVPGPIDAATSRGCNRLIADHAASIVTSSVALLQQIGIRRGVSPPTVVSLSETEGILLKHLLERSGSIEELIDRARLTAAVVATGLTMLEARGLVSCFGGATFHPSLAARRIGHAV